MTPNMLTVNGADVTSTLSQPPHINIHFHRESALAQLLNAGASLMGRLFHFQDIAPPKARMNHGPLVLGAMVAGAGTIVHEKYQGRPSGCTSGLFTLAGIATALAAVVLCVTSLTWQSDGFLYISSVCDRPAPDTTAMGYRWMRRSWSNSDWREDECRSSMQMLVNFFLGIRILLLAVSVLQAIVSLISLGVALQSLCSQSSNPLEEEKSEKQLPWENSVPPSPSKENTLAPIIP